MVALDESGGKTEGMPEADGGYKGARGKGPRCGGDMVLRPVKYCGRTEKREVKNNIWCCPTIKTCGILILATLFLINLACFIALWGTSIIENSIIKDMVIRNNTKTYEWWVKPPIEPYMRVRLFNYTNTERFLAGDDDKLTVEEVGPYTYRETLERVNVQFHPNGTVSYQEKRSFVYVPERSVGSVDDHITVPNIALLTSASIMKDSFYVVKLSMSMFLRHLDIQPFLELAVGDIFWGYNDTLFTMGQSVNLLKRGEDGAKDQKIGLLVGRNGTSRTRISIHTGENDIKQLGVIDRYAGRDKNSFWGSDECNKLDGTDGSMFPPHVDEDTVLHMYMKDMCRKFPLVFQDYVETAKGVAAMRFHPPRDVFATGETRPENACYCHRHSVSCPPAGVFNSSPCAFNAPLMMSFPHFHLGDPILLDMVDGLKPDPALHDMHIDVHPKFGFPVAGITRFQVNVMVRKSNGISHLERFEDETILPIAWFEGLVDDVPPEVDLVMQDITFATHTVKRIVLCSFLLILLVVVVVAVRYFLARHAADQGRKGGGASC